MSGFLKKKRQYFTIYYLLTHVIPLIGLPVCYWKNILRCLAYITPFYSTLIDVENMKNRPYIVADVALLGRLLVSSVVNPKYFNVVSYFYCKNQFNIFVAILASFLKYLYFKSTVSMPVCNIQMSCCSESTIVSRRRRRANTSRSAFLLR